MAIDLEDKPKRGNRLSPRTILLGVFLSTIGCTFYGANLPRLIYERDIKDINLRQIAYSEKERLRRERIVEYQSRDRRVPYATIAGLAGFAGSSIILTRIHRLKRI